MAQQLQALAILPVDPGPVPITHMAALVPGDPTPLHRHTCRQNPSAHQVRSKSLTGVVLLSFRSG